MIDDKELKAFIKKHKGTIHTREFPTRCGMCRVFARLAAAEKALPENKLNDFCWRCHILPEHYEGCLFKAWLIEAGKNESI
jgi:hypothetical protein